MTLRVKRSISLIVLSIIASAILIVPSSAKIVDKIVAVVNNEVITKSEVDRLLYPIYQQYLEIYKDEEELYKQLDNRRLEILRQLVDDRLLLSEARKLAIVVEAEEIDEYVVGIERELRDKGLQLDNLLKEQNLTLLDLRNKYKDQVLIKKAVEQQVYSSVRVQPSDISRYYTEHIEDYTQPEQVAVETIMIKLESVRTPIESRQLADDVHKMVTNGADFKEIASNYSEGPNKDKGGNLGFVARGELLKEIDSVIFFMKPNEISEVIETPVGYHIFRVTDRKEEKVLAFEEVRMQVSGLLFRKRAQEEFTEWLEKLRSNAYISIK